MRDNAVPCMNATLWQSRHGSHTTYNDDRICDACRVAASRFSRGRGSDAGERTPASASLRVSAGPGSGLGPGSASSVTAVSSHGSSGGTFAGFLSKSGAEVQRGGLLAVPPKPTPVGPRRNRQPFEWSSHRDLLAALRRL